ncbi:anti-sigma factor family protein [Streptomyces spiramenti]|uniref:Zf-HC2 domain-containing protein n=1 Tax=Streptomyces spiramenti TaxID=2720606 RepID=A0ABX1AKX0_9ACTN|nr:hypothetical protein [Streptomyces spiramenti]NJP64910.1 hypothetical protein [Streptomyces spiramenti]
MKEAHPDPAELAALGEDLLDPTESTAVRNHLLGCPRCTAVLQDLEALSAELPLLDPPGPMPAEVAERINAALAREATRVSRETAPSAEPASSATRPDPTAGSIRHVQPPTDEQAVPATGSDGARSGRRRHYLLAAVGAVIALGAGGLIAQSLGQEPNGSEVTAGALEGASSEDPEMFSEQIDSEALETEVQELLTAPAADSGGTVTESVPPSTEAPEPDPQSEAPPSSPESGPPGELTTQGGTPGGETPAESLDEGPLAESGAPECVLAATGRQDQPLAVADHYEYEGVDSYVLVLPDRGDDESVDVFVIDAACAIEQPSEAGVVLHADTYPRA